MAKLKTRMSHLMAWSWKDAKVTEYVGRDTFELAVIDTVEQFNLGAVAAINVYKECGIMPGKYTRESCKTEQPEATIFC